jgi:hypothetical protein
MHISKPFLVALLTLATLASSVAAQAQTAAQRNSVVYKACGSDLRKHCWTVVPGGGRMMACLQQQGAGLSATCQAEMPKLARCSQEVQRLCGDVTPEQLRACFESKREQFSPECQQLAPR